MRKRIRLKALHFVTGPETNYSTSSQAYEAGPNYAASAEELLERGRRSMRHNPAYGMTAVHEPDPVGLAVLVLDFFNKGPQRGFVGGIATEHLVS